jgi:hypothetical protein
MADTAAFLVDQLLPTAAYRQWVLTFPWAFRFRIAVDRPRPMKCPMRRRPLG